MNKTFKLKYIIGLLAIVTGAVATFDITIIPTIRYLAMYLSLFVIALVVIDSVYIDIDRDPSLDKIQDEQ